MHKLEVLQTPVPTGTQRPPPAHPFSHSHSLVQDHPQLTRNQGRRSLAPLIKPARPPPQRYGRNFHLAPAEPAVKIEPAIRPSIQPPVAGAAVSRPFRTAMQEVFSTTASFSEPAASATRRQPTQPPDQPDIRRPTRDPPPPRNHQAFQSPPSRSSPTVPPSPSSPPSRRSGYLGACAPKVNRFLSQPRHRSQDTAKPANPGQPHPQKRQDQPQPLINSSIFPRH